MEPKQIERLKAKERQGERSDLTSSSIDDKVSKRGIKTDAVVGAKVGMSESSYSRAKRVIESGDKELICRSKNIAVAKPAGHIRKSVGQVT